MQMRWVDWRKWVCQVIASDPSWLAVDERPWKRWYTQSRLVGPTGIQADWTGTSARKRKLRQALLVCGSTEVWFPSSLLWTSKYIHTSWKIADLKEGTIPQPPIPLLPPNNPPPTLSGIPPNMLSTDPHLWRTYDPDAWRENPIETKHRKLLRSQRLGDEGKDLKPGPVDRDRLNVSIRYDNG